MTKGIRLVAAGDAAAHGGRHYGGNVARGGADPAEAVRRWTASLANHREQILDPVYTELGVGFSPDGAFWAQVFGGR